MKLRWIAAAAAVTVLLAGAASPAGERERFLISVGPLDLAPRERVREFSITVKRGHISALPRVPWAWKVKLSNDEDGTAKLDAAALTGAGALKAEFFDEFAEVELAAGAAVRVKVETTVDWIARERLITFEDAQVSRRPPPG